jgi:xylulokinase
VHTFCHANGGWHAMSVMLSCGGATTWFRETVGGGADFGLLESEAMTVPPGSEGVTFLPYLAGERSPHNDPAARGAFTGLTLGHGRGHLTRAMYEGVTFGLADGYAAIEALGVSATELRVSSGGAQSAFWVQMLADVLGRPCVRLARDEGPALGAALLAAVAIGAFPDVEQAAGVAVRFRDRFEPGPAAYAAARERFRAQFASVAHPAQNAG